MNDFKRLINISHMLRRCKLILRKRKKWRARRELAWHWGKLSREKGIWEWSRNEKSFERLPLRSKLRLNNNLLIDTEQNTAPCNEDKIPVIITKSSFDRSLFQLSFWGFSLPYCCQTGDCACAMWCDSPSWLSTAESSWLFHFAKQRL